MINKEGQEMPQEKEITVEDLETVAGGVIEEEEIALSDGKYRVATSGD